jgi:putative ABC transport system ATP-binding protein
MSIVVENLCKTYHHGDVSITAVRNANLTIEPGEFIVLLGPSGGGKSTFLNLLGGMDRPTSGSVHFNGMSLESASEEQLARFRREKIGFIFQFYNLLPALNAVENTLLPLMARGMSADAARLQAVDLLTTLGLKDRLNHLPSRLSGGEQQRVAIARAIIHQPELVIADEPTGDLDSATSREIIHLMHELNSSQGITFVVATHNLAWSEKAHRIIEIRDGIFSV